MKRSLIALYGVVAYVLFLVAFLYAIGFVGNMVVPKSIDSGIPTGLGEALFTNVLLLALFAIQHTIMARRPFKRWITKIIPAEAERSTFVMMTNLVLFLLYWKWVPMPEVIWDLGGTAWGTVLTVLFWVGWLTVLVSTFLINHFDLFGLRQVWLSFKGQSYSHLAFTTRGLYRVVRHPIMLGFVVAFWTTPTMSAGHLLFAAVTTAYIVFGIWIEERDLVSHHGEAYLTYRRRVPALIPFSKRPAAD